MSDNTQLLRQAQVLYKTGDRHRARALVRTALQENPEDYRAWLWLATLAPSPVASLEYIQRAAKLRPNDATVRRAHAWAEKRLALQSAAASVASEVAETTPEAVARGEEIPEPKPSLPVTALPTIPGLQALNGRWRWFVGTAILLILSCGLLLSALVWLNGRSTDSVAAPGVSDDGRSVAAISGADRSAGESAPDVVPGVAAALAVPPTATPSAAQHVLAKQIVAQPEEPRATWTVTPSPSPTPPPTATPDPTATPFPTFVAPDNTIARPFGVGISERWIDVDLSSQTLVAYEGNTPVFRTLVSSGLWGTPTVIGQFRIYLRYESQTMNGYLLGYDYYLENVPYVQYFFEDYALHGAYWHNNFGTPMSHGCVNLHPDDAEWLYYWAGIGTLVNVHN